MAMLEGTASGGVAGEKGHQVTGSVGGRKAKRHMSGNLHCFDVIKFSFGMGRDVSIRGQCESLM